MITAMKSNIKKYILFITVVLAAAVSCMKDGEMLKVTPPGEPADFGASASEITLSQSDGDNLMLSLFWNAGALPQVSDPTVALPDNLTDMTLQASASNDFATVHETWLEPEATDIQFTGTELSQLMMKLGFSDDQPHDVYFRLAIKMGTSYIYSDVITLKITPYAVETGIMHIVDKNDLTAILATLRTKDEASGLYEGFAVTTGGWYNCFFVAADGTVWGCDADWKAFSLVSGSANNCWFAEPAGCQYVYADTMNETWWHVYIPSVDALVEGTPVSLRYSKSAGGFSGTITTASAGAAVTVSGTGARFDIATGTDSGISGTEYPFCLEPSADGSFVFTAAESTTAAITVEKAGTYTLTFNVAECRWTLKEGAAEEEEEDPWPDDPDFAAAEGELLYIFSSDNDKNPISEAGRLLLDNGIYKGFFEFTPWFNFQFADGADASAAKLYGSAPVDGGLNRLFCGSSKWNIWFDQDATVYTYITVDMTGRSWAYEAVEKISIVGDFNSWSLTSDVMTYDSASKTWSASISPSAWGEWGIHFVINDNWDLCLSDSNLDGLLDFGTTDFMPSVEAKPYKVTIDLNDPQNMTYEFE